MTIHIYCVIEALNRESFGFPGVDGRGEVYAITCRDLAAVVSQSQLPGLTTLPKEELVRCLFAHQSVIEKVMRNYTVIPVKFGTTASSAQEVERMLDKGYGRLKDALNAMEGRIELDVAATWNKELVLKDVSREEEIVRFRADIGLRPTAEDKLKLGQMVESCLNRRKEMLAPEIVAALAEVAEDSCPHDTPDVAMIVNAAFLTEKAGQERFDHRLDEIDREYEGRLNFRRVGPLPPYSFCTAAVTTADVEEITTARHVLGLGVEATPSRIKEAYWDLSAAHHPDRYPDDPEIQERYAAIAKAYQVLNRYCSGDLCSFREEDVRVYIDVDIVRIGKTPAGTGSR